MEYNLSQSQKTEQRLAITPAQQRSLEILQKASTELQAYIARELETNPLLDIDENDDPAPETVGADEDGDDFDAEDFGEQSPQKDAQAQQAAHDFLINSRPDSVRLGEKLVNEARMDAPSEEVADAFEYLVELLDSRGFLPTDAVEKTVAQGFDKDTVQAALELLQSSEPAGIGARDIRETFLIQLAAKKMSNSLAARILEEHFDLFLKRRVDEIAKLEGRSIEDVENAISEIAKLNPSPAYDYTVDEENVLVPDVEFFRENGVWDARLTNNYIPKLRINPYYRQMVADGELGKEAQSYVREKIRDGKSLIDAVRQRQATTLKIARAIIARQRDFFESGKLAPMTRQNIADDIGMHAATVSRAIQGKNADTPIGVIPLANFFTNSVESGGAEAVSSNTVKEKIRDIISGEDVSAPLSDQKIGEMLAADGMAIARRTVAKYREELGIPAKTLRKRF